MTTPIETPARVIEECLARFFAAEGMVGTDTRPERSLKGRKDFRLHFAHDTVEAIKGESVIPELKRERLVPWEVIATDAVIVALHRFLEDEKVALLSATWQPTQKAQRAIQGVCREHSLTPGEFLEAVLLAAEND